MMSNCDKDYMVHKPKRSTICSLKFATVSSRHSFWEVSKKQNEQISSKKIDNLIEIDKLIENYNLPKLTKETEYLYNLTIIKGIKFVIIFPQRKLQAQRPFLVNFTKHLKVWEHNVLPILNSYRV